jgi:hypothetical protein
MGSGFKEALIKSFDRPVLSIVGRAQNEWYDIDSVRGELVERSPEMADGRCQSRSLHPSSSQCAGKSH